MYGLSRLVLMLVVLGLLACLCIAALRFGAFGLAVPLLILGIMRVRKGVKFWAFGTARWANAGDLYRKGMLQ